MLLSLLLLAGLATYRLVRLAIVDSIFDTPRERVHSWLIDRNSRFTDWLLELVICQWCLGIWMAGAVTAVIAVASDLDLGVALWVLFALATAALHSFLSVLETVAETYVDHNAPSYVFEPLDDDDVPEE